MSDVPDPRVEAANEAPVRPERDFVLYWMIAARRPRFNFALERAVERAKELGKPLVVLEALRCDYPWASRRLHRFALDGMADNRRRLARAPVLYHPYVEREKGAGKGLLAALAERAAVVVTDDYPAFFLPRMVAAAAGKLDVRLERVDSNGILPMAAADRVFSRAFDFRRFLQRELPGHLAEAPRENPLARSRLPKLERLPEKIAKRWPAAGEAELGPGSGLLDGLPIDREVAEVATAGGERAAAKLLASFVEEKLERYDEDSNHPDAAATSGLSPYLHFGHLSAHQVFAAIVDREDWNPGRLGDGASGARSGWWGMGAGAEAFLDQLVTWRELGFNMCSRRDDHDRYDTLPEWARRTLAEHRDDPREPRYGLAELAAAATYDPVWNAAQTELAREGRIHNYLRMLWGKKILEWSQTPREALARMLELNDRYALDGRDPNSVSGIFWCLGRYDRAWGPERPIFGKVRYMSSESAKRKLRMRGYLETYGGESGSQAGLFE